MSVAMEQQAQQTRPRSKSTFSFKSQNSHSSDPNHHERNISGSAHGHQRKESDSYKPHLTASGKADPNAAMNEVQPIAAALEKPTLQSLRSFQHTDKDGVPIAEPDLSNPTRSRWERPLDTIRSFEAAIDSEYRRRANTMRDTSTEVMSGYNSRRSSYYGGGGGHYDQGRFSQASGYYGNRQAARDSYQDNGYGMGGPVGGMGGPPRTRYNRMQSDPGWNRYPQGNGGNGVYPVQQGYQQSRDTVNTNGSNGSHSEPYSTEPSSDNSSIERSAGGMKPDMGEQYGFNGFGGGPILEEYHTGMGPGRNGYAVQRPDGTLNYGAPPPVPMKQGPPPPPAHANKPIKLTKSNEAPNGEGRPAIIQRQSTEKRKSWFKRRFSKD